MKNKFLAIVAVALLAGPGSAAAATINIFFDATDASYTWNGVANTGNFTVQLTSDTTSVLTNPNGTKVYVSLAPTVTLAGIGTATATSATYFVFVNPINEAAGFGINGPGDRWDLFLPGAGLGSYDFVTDFGPFSTASMFITTGTFLSTNLGDLLVSSVRLGTFRVEVDATVPEPGTLALLGLGLAGLGFSRRRKSA